MFAQAKLQARKILVGLINTFFLLPEPLTKFILAGNYVKQPLRYNKVPQI